MPLFKELDDRMTVNIQSGKKKHLQSLAEAEHMSLSKFILEKIVDVWLEKRSASLTHDNEESNGRTRTF